MRHDGSYRCLYSKTKQVDDKVVMQLRAQQGSRLKKGKKKKASSKLKKERKQLGTENSGLDKAQGLNTVK